MNLVIIPFHDYKKWINEGFRTRDAHLCEHFSMSDKIEKILVVNRPCSYAEMIIKRSSWKTNGGNIEYKKGRIQLNRMKDKIWCIDILLPEIVSVVKEKKTWWFTAFNNAFVIDAINVAIDYLNINNNYLFLQNPMATGSVKGIKTNGFVFDAIDNWLYHPQMPDKELIKKNYKYIEDNADLILTVSEALKKVFKKNKNVYWVPNGVDTNLFLSAVRTYQRKPVIGYVGKIQDRVDFELVERCLNALDNRFVFIGPILSQEKKIKELQSRYNNIIFTGDVHYTKLPQMMREIDIAIIPHSVDKFTESMNPLKLYEYLAAGKPVVTTSVAGVTSISKYVYEASSNSEFVDTLKTLTDTIKNINPLDVVNSIPEECSWNNRTNSIQNLINQLQKE